MSTAPLARADITRNVDLTTFRPSPAVEPGLFSVEAAGVGRSGAWSVGVSLDHAVDPLVVSGDPDNDDTTVDLDRPVTARTATVLMFSYAFAKRFEAGVVAPLLRQTGMPAAFSGIAPAQGYSLGAVALHGKAALLSVRRLRLASSATVTLPTAGDGGFAGSKWPPNLHVRAIIDMGLGRVNVALNAGYRLREMNTLGDVEQGNEFTYGVGAEYRVFDPFSAMAEVFGAAGLGADQTGPVNPLEMVAGVRYRVTRQLWLAAGAGRGLLGGIGSPKVRGFVQLSFSPASQAIEPIVPLRPIDRGDDDQDGVINSDDECPTRSEDRDGFQDDDGCPDPDNDDDGVLDGNDNCPEDAEDRDGFQDDDGCPDLDNDEDGVPDAKDKCPTSPEDKDGYQDNDGCPDPDNDRDGILDAVDQCVDEPETINGNNDDDGCPDPGEPRVLVMADRIELFEPIAFRGNTARLTKRSSNILGQVAATLRASPTFLRVRIAVHVHPGRNKKKDRRLSTSRAKAIRHWLVKWGIDEQRLLIKGYGSAKPLVSNKQPSARKVNERVEFIILERDVKGKPAR